MRSIGCRDNAELIVRQAPQLLSFLLFLALWHHRKVCLIYVCLAFHRYLFLSITNARENLLKPISSRGIGVSIVYRRYAQALELEKMYAEFYPFGKGDFVRVKKCSGERGEPFAARLAAMPSRPILLVAVLHDCLALAGRAGTYFQRVQEPYLQIALPTML